MELMDAKRMVIAYILSIVDPSLLVFSPIISRR